MRVYTIEEASQLVPFLERTFEGIFALNTKIKMVSRDIDNLISIWGNEIFEKSNVDNEYYKEKTKQREQLIREMASEVQKIQDMGCIVKDVDVGLVDFHYDNYGELVFLCWKFGEKEILYWHPMSQGYRNRRSVDELLAMRKRTP
ncbi:MAG: DUF2203 domain-containing protein [Candidatus Aenigmarchaeota archaeon]|nr:DUF2203 domain-containing protein [Candidatus Aenigmarchaeota archaeon]